MLIFSPLFQLTFSLLLILSPLNANDLFNKLPYKIKLGKRVPLKVEDKMVIYNYQYEIMGKFALDLDKDTKVVKGIIFSYDDFDVPTLLPKAWRKAGLKLCYYDQNGTKYDTVKDLLPSTDAYDIDEFNDFYRRVISFKIGSNKQYELVFYSEAKKDEHGSGLAYITITQVDGLGIDEDY